MASKLTFAHIWPTVWQRMTVSLATQLFSNSVAMAMEYFRDDVKFHYLFKGTIINCRHFCF